jgi:hypothetical protein
VAECWDIFSVLEELEQHRGPKPASNRMTAPFPPWRTSSRSIRSCIEADVAQGPCRTPLMAFRRRRRHDRGFGQRCANPVGGRVGSLPELVRLRRRPERNKPGRRPPLHNDDRPEAHASDGVGATSRLQPRHPSSGPDQRCYLTAGFRVPGARPASSDFLQTNVIEVAGNGEERL